MKNKQIDKPLAELSKKKKRNTNVRGGTAIDIEEIQRVRRDHYEQLHTNKLDNLDKLNTFLEPCNLPRLSHEDLEI